jgi:hypothetical protein
MDIFDFITTHPGTVVLVVLGIKALPYLGGFHLINKAIDTIGRRK